jgi:hypothetical protein
MHLQISKGFTESENRLKNRVENDRYDYRSNHCHGRAAPFSAFLKQRPHGLNSAL